MAESKTGKRRSVASRVLLSYVGIVLAFALSTGWSVSALSQAAREAKVVRSGYLPLALALGELVAEQDLHNTQLNHITSARNPADIRMWFEFAKQGAPRKFAEVRSRIHSSLGVAPDVATRAVGKHIAQLTVELEARTERDARSLEQLFEAIEQRQLDQAEALRDGLSRSGLALKNDLRALQDRVERTIEDLHQQATLRERRAIQLLLGLSMLALMVGILMAAYAQRVLRPLGVVTQRANAVASGDLRPRTVVATNDEIGELARTFESMVAKIAEANRQLLMTERLATIGKMAAHVTHEIRNPLSSIALNLELLEEELGGASNVEVKNLLQAIQREVERLTALSEQYLSMARKQPLELLPEDLRRIVEVTLAFSRPELERAGIELVFEASERLPTLQLDEAQMRQALLNLLRNAKESMPQGGRLEIRLGVVAGKVELSVKDTGEGMAPHTLERLFEPFFTTKGRGTGLGLAVVKQIVTAHGARIECSSSRGKGTEFRIIFGPGGGQFVMTEMRLVVVATTNLGKLREIRQLLREVPVEVRALVEVAGDVPAIEESGTTFEANALLKANAAAALCGEISLADDSGLEVDALAGRPGVLSARYAGSNANDAANVSRVLDELQGVEPPFRSARFVCALALVENGRQPLVVRGICEGAIAASPRGSEGFGYDPIFIPAACPTRTMAELSFEDKQLLSHRGKALRELLRHMPWWLAQSRAP